MKRLVIVLIFLFSLIMPAYAVECCDRNVQTTTNCGEDILHNGACTGNEAFLLEYSTLNKKYVLLKSFENGNEAFSVFGTSVNARTLEGITTVQKNERLGLNVDTKKIIFNGAEVNDTSFLTRYGIRGYNTGKLEIPEGQYKGVIDIVMEGNKTSIDLNPGSKIDLTLTNNELTSLKDTSFKYNNNSYNAAERLSFKGLYLDSGSFFSSTPEPFIEAEKATYLLSFIDNPDLAGLNSTAPFNLKFLGKDASIYELNPPARVLLSLDKNVNFRNDGDDYDSNWKWTVSAASRLSLGLDAKGIRQTSGCIEFPFGYAKACPRQINKSELLAFDVKLTNLTQNNMTAKVLQVNVSQPITLEGRRLQSFVIADTFAYRTFVLLEMPKAAETAAEISIVENKTRINQTGQNITTEEKSVKESNIKNLFTIKNIKIGLYSLLAIFLLVVIVRLILNRHRNI